MAGGRRRTALAEAYEALYRQIPAFLCKPECSACCRPGPACALPVPFSGTEWARIPEKKRRGAGFDEVLLYPQAGSHIRSAFRAIFSPPTRCPFSCPKGCAIYEKRSFMCRLFGAAASLPCPFGCRPDRMLTKAEADELTRRYGELMAAEDLSLVRRTDGDRL